MFAKSKRWHIGLCTAQCTWETNVAIRAGPRHLRQHIKYHPAIPNVVPASAHPTFQSSSSALSPTPHSVLFSAPMFCFQSRMGGREGNKGGKYTDRDECPSSICCLMWLLQLCLIDGLALMAGMALPDSYFLSYSSWMRAETCAVISLWMPLMWAAARLYRK